MSDSVQQPAPVPPPRRRRDNWDIVALGSFVGAGVLSAFTICNNIRTKFYHAFVEGHGESRTPFSDILQEYNGQPGVKAMPVGRMPELHEADGKFDALAIRKIRGEITPEQFLKDQKELTAKFRGDINDRIKKVFKIESDGISGWTKGNWDRWNMLGHGSKREASLAFAAVSALGIGAVAILRHSKRTLDHIEADLDQQRGR